MEKNNFSTVIKILKKNFHFLFSMQKSQLFANLKRNWYFPISAMAFFCLNPTSLGYLVGIPIAFIASLVIASFVPSMFAFAKQNRMWYHIVSLTTAIGICLGNQASFSSRWSASPKTQALREILPIPVDISVITYILCVLAVIFVYFFVLVFWRKMIKLISENGIFDDITATEWVVYSILIVALLALVVTSFVQTDAFYGTKYEYDIIYTSDSPSLVKNNAYLALTHAENDLRQPLFAVFAAPFIGLPYFVGKLIGAPACVQAILMDMVQVIMLFVANFMLAKIMKLNPFKRVFFMILTSCTYTQLLFTLMMEQYIVAYFWLFFCIYLIFEKQHPERIALWGAGGTLLTSMVLLPFMPGKNPIRNFKEWIADVVKYGLEFVAVILVFCRFDVIFSFVKNVSFLSNFAGHNITLTDKIYQYSAFVFNYFIAPNAGVNNTAVNHISWQLNPVTSISFIGVAILLLVIVSAILNRDKKSSLIAAGWGLFSVVMLIGLGWGTKGNGLTLYALYFGWPFLVLLFQLVERLEDKLKIKFLIPLFSIGCAVVLAVVNIPEIIEMVNFAIAYFPV